MKQCPTCKNTYTDHSLVYCLADGATLIDAGTEAETVVRPGMRVDIPPQTNPTVPVETQQTSSGSGRVIKVVAAILIVGFLGLVGLGAAGFLFYLNTGGPDTAGVSPTPAANTSPTPDAEKDRLEKELANLQKQLENINTAPSPQASKTPPGFESDDLPTARVNSPNDGFLALRSEPDSEHGERLAQIPHGTVIILESCEKEKVKIGTRTGRWCLVTYRDHTGWVFDAWLDY